MQAHIPPCETYPVYFCLLFPYAPTWQTPPYRAYILVCITFSFLSTSAKHKAVLHPKHSTSLTAAVELTEARCFYNGTAHSVMTRCATVLESASSASTKEAQLVWMDPLCPFPLLGLHENVPLKNGNHYSTGEHRSMRAKLSHMLPNSRSWEALKKMHRERGGPGCNIFLWPNLQMCGPLKQRWTSMPALYFSNLMQSCLKIRGSSAFLSIV